ncbi:hypothetical protein A2U01_0031045 [Trifolium medium]|uniref:Uncharacterized protein n=1 Tax=Trifolium medium TaxID=97028 RepID=A0A392PDV0_9FABA|nr:hypothetical protein [Trifolium medium]
MGESSTEGDGTKNCDNGSAVAGIGEQETSGEEVILLGEERERVECNDGARGEQETSGEDVILLGEEDEGVEDNGGALGERRIGV